MKIQNKDALLFCLDKAFDEFEEVNRMPSKGNDGYYAAGTLLMWTICCYERIEKENLLIDIDNAKEKMYGLKFANNCLKHNPDLIKVEVVADGRTIPFNLHPEGVALSEYRWGNLDSVKAPTNSKKKQIFESQKNYYKMYFEGKSISHTMQTRIENIKKCFEKDI